MANDNISITSGSGVSVDTRTTATDGDHRQVVVIGDPATDADVAPVDATLGLSVNLTAGTAVFGKLAANSGVDIGDVDILSVIPGVAATSLGKAEDAGHTSGDVGVFTLGVRNDSDVALTGADLDYSPFAVTASGKIVTATNGMVAHDSADSVNPVKIGMRAVDFGATPTAVAADDLTNWYSTRAGVPFVLGGHPNTVTKNLQITDADGAQTDTAIVTVAAGTVIVVTKVSVTADNANSGDVSCRIGFGTANTPAADAEGVVFFHPGIDANSVVIEGDGSGIIGIGATNEDLRVTCEDPTDGSISIIATYFTIAIG